MKYPSLSMPKGKVRAFPSTKRPPSGQHDGSLKPSFVPGATHNVYERPAREREKNRGREKERDGDGG
jgi:hypothetical protein